jgi:hypothetical protein
VGFRITFSASSGEEGRCKVIVSVGDIQATSTPQAVQDHFRDIEANRYFLAKKVLAKFFIAEEPLINLAYGAGDVVEAYLYTRSRLQRNKISNEFSHNIVSSYLEDVQDKLGLLLDAKGISRSKLIGQVTEDILLGVYDVYLTQPHL